MFDWTWEEILERFNIVAEGRKGDMVGNISQGMANIIPELQTAIKAANLNSIRVIKTMLSIELSVATKRYLVRVSCKELGLYIIYIKKDWVDVKEESVAHENVVPLVVKYLSQISNDSFEL